MGIKSALEQYSSLGPNGLNVAKVTTLQQNLDSLTPGLAAVLLTLLCLFNKEKNKSNSNNYCIICSWNSSSSTWYNVI